MKFKYILFLFFVFFIGNFDVLALEDGVYKIESFSSDKVLQYNGNLKNGSNVNIGNFKNLNNQKWIIKMIGDSYVITSLNNSFYSLDVMGGLNNIGVNVHMWEYNNTLAQRWIIKEDGDYFNIISLCNGMYLDVTGANFADGINIHMWEGNGTSAQKFKLVKLDYENNLDNGDYYIESTLKNNYILGFFDNNFDGGINDYSFINSFSISNFDGKFAVKKNDKYLGVFDGNIVLNDNEFLWNIEDNYDGTVSFIYDGYYLDYRDSIQLIKFNGYSSQKFRLKKVDTSFIDDGTYSIINNGYYLSFDGIVPTCGKNVLLSKNNSKWNIKRIEDNIYEIRSSINDRYVLDVSAGLSDNGTNIQVWESNGTLAQRFRIVKNGDYYNFIGVGFKCIDIAYGNINDKTNIWLWENNGSLAQRFKIEKTEVLFEKIEDGKYVVNSSLNLNKGIKFYNSPYIYDMYGSGFDIVDVKYDGNGFYTLSCNGLYLTDDGILSMRSYSGSDRQAWFLLKNGNYFTLCSKYSGNVIDVPAANSSNGIRLQMFESNGTLAQKFYFEGVLDDYIETGYYNIKINDNFLINDNLNNGSKIRLGNISKWYIKNISDNIYEIKSSINPNMVLDVTGGQTYDGNIVQMYLSNLTSSQRFRIMSLKNGKYKFISERSHTVLSLDGILKIYSNFKTGYQEFDLIKTDDEVYERTIDDGYYIIKSSSGKVLKDDLSLSEYDSKVSSIWKFSYNENGFYNISSALFPKKKLSFDGDLRLVNGNGTVSQMWMVKILEDNKILISNSVSLNDIFSCDFSLIPYSDIKKYEGIDISKWQGNIDFEKLSLEKPNFIIMRLGYGEKDSRFEDYYNSAIKYDIPIGAYTHSKALSVVDAYNEALKTIDWLDGRNLDLPVFYDIEDDNQISLGKDELTKISMMFCDTLISNNYSCGIYANKWWLNEYLNAYDLSLKYPIWMAHYTGVSNYVDALNHFSDYNASSYKYWQFTDKGNLSGITENTVDLDFGFDIYD